jgi:hypothetical protein
LKNSLVNSLKQGILVIGIGTKLAEIRSIEQGAFERQATEPGSSLFMV